MNCPLWSPYFTHTGDVSTAVRMKKKNNSKFFIGTIIYYNTKLWPSVQMQHRRTKWLPEVVLPDVSW